MCRSSPGLYKARSGMRVASDAQLTIGLLWAVEMKGGREQGGFVQEEHVTKNKRDERYR